MPLPIQRQYYHQAMNADAHVRRLLLDALTLGDLVQIKESPDLQDIYDITSVSTAAMPDREDETFTVQAIDYDIAIARQTGIYPEYRMYHVPSLGIGRVTKMYRVGIFAVEEGHSYGDAFSLSVCKDLLSVNDGKWRTSRGFAPLEVNANCHCGKPIGLTNKHMVIGFQCPHCRHGHLTYKGMNGVRYMKAQTFDITVTDIPAVVMTAMQATKRRN